LFEPRFWVFRMPPQEGGRIAWHLATVSEPVEGSTGILRGPSRLLVLLALGSLLPVAVMVFDAGVAARKSRISLSRSPY
jgi:hypothetical protein